MTGPFMSTLENCSFATCPALPDSGCGSSYFYTYATCAFGTMILLPRESRGDVAAGSVHTRTQKRCVYVTATPITIMGYRFERHRQNNTYHVTVTTPAQ